MPNYKKKLIEYGGSLLNEEFKLPSHLRMSNPPQEKLPISAKKISWEVVKNPTRFSKTFEFEHVQLLASFVQEVLEFQSEINHYAQITIKDNKTVSIDAWTKHLENITELDQELIRMIDLIYKDVLGFDIGN